MKSRLLYFATAQVCLCLLLLLIWPRLELDDSFIFLAYARNLAKSGIFAFNPGEASYGFSSPAYVMFLAALSRLSGIPVGIALSNIVGVLLCGVSSAAVWAIWGEMEGQPSNREMFFASVLLSGPWFFTVWFIYGMETGLAVASLLGFLLWLMKLRAGAPRFPWLVVGVIAASVLSTTRLEAGIYIACGILFAAVTSKTMRERIDLATVAILAGGAELMWLLYAKKTFGTMMPWTSTARLLYYLPNHFGLSTAGQFYDLNLVGRSVVALKAFASVVFGGPLKLLLVFVPLLAGVSLLWRTAGSVGLAEDKAARSRWVLQLAVASMIVEIIVFAYFFPLVQNRHLAPYIAGVWVLSTLPLVRFVSRMKLPLQMAAVGAVVILWIGGAAQYRLSGQGMQTLHDIAASGVLLPTDRVAAEPIGILAFETRAHIIDVGGLTDQSAWPLLKDNQREKVSNIVAWDISKGATKVLLSVEDCGTQGLHFKGYCLIDAAAAAKLKP